MSKLLNLVSILALFASMTVMSCATASNKTAEVGNDTGNAVGSVGDGVVSVVEWPFHVIADVL
jgi:hypothetical protein